MTEQKDFESLDDLFRKTFDNLPETPAKSGWDTPSEQVWKHVQKQIKPPQSGWSTQTLSLIAAFAVIITVGLYLLFNLPGETEKPAGTTPSAAETVEQPVASVTEDVAPAQPAAPEATTLPAKSGKKKASGTGKSTPRNNAKPEAADQIPSGGAFEKPATPGRKVPNTTLRLKAELAKHAEEAWKTPLDPLPKRWPEGSEN